MIKLGTYLNRYEGLSFEERVRMIKSVGFDFIAFGMAYLEENKPEDVIEIAKKSKRSIFIEGVTAGGRPGYFGFGKDE